MSFTLAIAAGLGLLLAIYFRIRDHIFGRSRPGIAVVLVLGDIGCSPRIRNHAECLARCAKQGLLGLAGVQLMGYTTTSLPTSLLANSHLSVSSLATHHGARSSTLRRIVKVASDLAVIWLVLLQSPPSVPHSLALKIICKIRGASLIIDCHNYGHTLLPAEDKIVRAVAPIFKFTEIAGLKLADKYEYQAHLATRFGVSASVLYDRPLGRWGEPTKDELEAMRAKYMQQDRNLKPGSTIATLITATSYTPDEDLSILLDALNVYSRKKTANHPKLLVVITGKGPMEAQVRAKIKSLQDESDQTSKFRDHISIHQLFCEADEYPTVLACADVGVSLHTSSSGLDLPMKVVDMIGAKLPVLSVDYPAIHEVLGKEGTFSGYPEALADKLLSILDTFPTTRFKCTNKLGNESWENSWDRIVFPALTGF